MLDLMTELGFALVEEIDHSGWYVRLEWSPVSHYASALIEAPNITVSYESSKPYVWDALADAAQRWRYDMAQRGSYSAEDDYLRQESLRLQAREITLILQAKPRAAYLVYLRDKLSVGETYDVFCAKTQELVALLQP
jgi:hypothetical protein